MPKPKQRLDEYVVQAQLVADVRAARGLIMSHQVLVDDAVVTKPGAPVRPGARVRLRRPLGRYVSRGGDKLAGALERFGLDVRGRVCLDAGACTGGFTDCLLQHGARLVYAVDVGHGQLHSRLVLDERVVSLEKTNISDLGPGSFGPGVPTLCTADLSYLSLVKAVPVLEAVVAPGALLVCLVKPLFEGLAEVSHRDPAALERVLGELLAAVEAVATRRILACAASPITGSNGSIEFLVLLGARSLAVDRQALAAAAVREAARLHGL